MIANLTFITGVILVSMVVAWLLLRPLWTHYGQATPAPNAKRRGIMSQFASQAGGQGTGQRGEPRGEHAGIWSSGWTTQNAAAIEQAEGDTRFKVARHQLTELERDLDYALVAPDLAQISRQEIEHRLLRYADLAEMRPEVRVRPARPAPDGDKDGTLQFLHSAPSYMAARVGLLCLAVFFIGGALGLYLVLGVPGQPDLPLHQRGAEWTARQELRQLVVTLEQHLQEHPDDSDGFAVLGQSRLNLGQLDGSIAAFDHALALAPERIDIAEKLGQVLVAETSGIVTPRAASLFRQVLAKEPDAALSRYYTALAKEQGGDKAGAFNIFLELGHDSPKTAPWLPDLQAHLDNLGRALGRAVPQFLDPLAVANGGETNRNKFDSTLPILSRDDVTKMSGLSPEQRQEKILAMVDQLALRLRDNPNDAEGWFRLSKARAILGQHELSRDAVTEAARRGPERIDIQLAYAHTLYPPELSQTPPPSEFMTVMRRILSLDPLQPEALWFVGRAELTSGNKELGRSLLTRLLNRLPNNSPIRGDVIKALNDSRQPQK
ncbi:MAG: tetratricopeptide repeat protein [Candidatus Symbiobacter sp.]|nr:tetratricopeptide repeat protein [Candidatus Symbiobacter sp.]